LTVRHELNATSSQDEFAKWAKLRRQHDKLLEELEKNSRTQRPIDLRERQTDSLLITCAQNPESTPPARNSTAT
jgi:hypothetical protein